MLVVVLIQTSRFEFPQVPVWAILVERNDCRKPIARLMVGDEQIGPYNVLRHMEYRIRALNEVFDFIPVSLIQPHLFDGTDPKRRWQWKVAQ